MCVSVPYLYTGHFAPHSQGGRYIWRIRPDSDKFLESRFRADSRTHWYLWKMEPCRNQKMYACLCMPDKLYNASESINTLLILILIYSLTYQHSSSHLECSHNPQGKGTGRNRVHWYTVHSYTLGPAERCTHQCLEGKHWEGYINSDFSWHQQLLKNLACV